MPTEYLYGSHAVDWLALGVVWIVILAIALVNRPGKVGR